MRSTPSSASAARRAMRLRSPRRGPCRYRRLVARPPRTMSGYCRRECALQATTCGRPTRLYLKRPAPDQEPGLTAMIDAISDTVSYRQFATAKELEPLLTDDLAVLLSESFAGATISIGASRPSPAGPGEPDGTELPPGTLTFRIPPGTGRPSGRRWRSRCNGTIVFSPR